MADFLLELRSEEIPARMQRQAAADFERLFAAGLAGAGLKADSIETFVTPRRLALIARGLPAETAAVSEVLKGPRTAAPPQALEGFLRKTGLTQDRLEDRGGVWFAVIDKPGRKTAEVLAETVPAVVRAFPWPKSMRWGAASLSTESLRWVRPLQGIVALLDGGIVPVEIGGVVSGRTTRGHRFMSAGEIEISGAGDYAEKLRAAHVIVSSGERARIITDRAGRLAADAGLELIEDEGLTTENAGLTEWPVPLLGRFDPAFLDVPPEVIQLTMRTNQKYFALRDKAGNLAPAFVCTANIEASDGGAAIIAGNQKVLAARLSDARFFWEQDRRKPLAEHAVKLEDIIFHEKLGTVADKVQGLIRVARHMSGRLGSDQRAAEQAALLCKADLTTGMVGEFPELQGLMGGYYAQAEGLPDDVAAAIRDHYKPVGQGDDVPTAPTTIAVAMADKLVNLGSFASLDEWPTGSKDPYALRRAALGILQLILRNNLRLPIGDLADIVLVALNRAVDRQRWSDFFADRLKVQQREAGVRHDLIDAVFALGGEDDLVRLLARVKALQNFIGTGDGANLLVGYRRAANILAAEAKKGVLPAAPETLPYTPEPAEAALIAALDAAEHKAGAAVAAENFEGAMAALAALRAPIDDFFDGVTVNDADATRRACRLALLERMRAAVHLVADFSKIEG